MGVGLCVVCTLVVISDLTGVSLFVLDVKVHISLLTQTWNVLLFWHIKWRSTPSGSYSGGVINNISWQCLHTSTHRKLLGPKKQKLKVTLFHYRQANWHMQTMSKWATCSYAYVSRLVVILDVQAGTTWINRYKFHFLQSKSEKQKESLSGEEKCFLSLCFCLLNLLADKCILPSSRTFFLISVLIKPFSEAWLMVCFTVRWVLNKHAVCLWQFMDVKLKLSTALVGPALEVPDVVCFCPSGMFCHISSRALGMNVFALSRLKYLSTKRRDCQ